HSRRRPQLPRLQRVPRRQRRLPGTPQHEHIAPHRPRDGLRLSTTARSARPPPLESFPESLESIPKGRRPPRHPPWAPPTPSGNLARSRGGRSEEHTSELQSREK